jgi:hypothetical protein
MATTPEAIRAAVYQIRLKRGDDSIRLLKDGRYYRPDRPPPDIADLLANPRPRRRRRRIDPIR